jgi:hypothetical protein
MNKLILAASALGVLLLLPAVHGITKETVIVTVNSKERVTTGDDSRYLVYTENEVFENTDSAWFFKFNSADVYGSIREGASCTFEVAGVRNRFFSWFRNILTADCS